MAGAALTFGEGWKGTLRPGFAADPAVLSEDPTAIDADRLRDRRCRLTVVGGRIVHREGL
ncbi:MAG: amidohydrolase family protein [Alphaproteobacteria bacterium]